MQKLFSIQWRIQVGMHPKTDNSLNINKVYFIYVINKIYSYFIKLTFEIKSYHYWGHLLDIHADLTTLYHYSKPCFHNVEHIFRLDVLWRLGILPFPHNMISLGWVDLWKISFLGHLHIQWRLPALPRSHHTKRLKTTQAVNFGEITYQCILS